MRNVTASGVSCREANVRPRGVDPDRQSVNHFYPHQRAIE
jgi:hypothetical protein